MKGIIKSQLYETKVTLSMWIAIVVAFSLVIMEWIGTVEYYAGSGPLTGTVMLGETDASLISIYLFCFIIAHFMCRDWKNKTIYLDVLSGYSRKEVFFGRLIPAFVIGVIAVLVLTYGHVVCQSIVGGWGSNLTLADIAINVLVYVLMLFRLTGELALFSMIIKRTSVVVILFLILDYMEFFFIVLGGAPIEFPWFFGMFLSHGITAPSVNEAFNEAGEIVQVYSFGTLQDNMIMMVSSAVIGAVGLLIAYRMFRKKQLS